MFFIHLCVSEENFTKCPAPDINHALVKESCVTVSDVYYANLQPPILEISSLDK